MKCVDCGRRIVGRPDDEPDQVEVCVECWEGLAVAVAEALEGVEVDPPKTMYREGQVIRWHALEPPSLFEQSGDGRR